jgi:hypothetical protein
MVFWGPSVIPILVFHNTSRQMICMLIVCNRQSQGTSWWEACWNNGSQGLWIQELGLSSIDHWFWHPAGKAHCWSPCTPQTWPTTFFWQSNGLMANKKFHVSDVLFDCTLSSWLETLQRCAATQVLDLLHSFRDVQHLGTWHLVDLCTHVQSHYPGCIEKLFMVNVPLIFYGVWKGGRLDLSFHPQILPKKTLNLWNQIVSCMLQIQSLISVEGIQPLQCTTSTWSVSPIWSWDWSSQCTYLTMDCLA